MSIEAVRKYFEQVGLEKEVLEFAASSATVDLAAQALDVIPARIAKTLSFRNEQDGILLVAAGDTKVDNSKFKAEFGIKAKMMSPDEVLAVTGHAVGGVCPFALKISDLPVFLDVSLKRFDTVFPACGSSHSAIELNCEELYRYSHGIKWVDVCKNWQE